MGMVLEHSLVFEHGAFEDLRWVLHGDRRILPLSVGADGFRFGEIQDSVFKRSSCGSVDY